MHPPVLAELRSLVQRHDEELRRLVAMAVRAGARTQDVADALGVSRSTLWRRYRAELRRDDAADWARAPRATSGLVADCSGGEPGIRPRTAVMKVRR